MVPDRKFGGYWAAAIAIGVIAATALAIAFAWHFLEAEQPEFAEDPKEERIDPAYYPGGRECQPSVVNRLPWRERLERAATCRESAEQHRLSTNDLIQQRRAANAAATSAYLAHFQTIVGIAGMGVGFLTLCAAGAAAFYAKDAAEATKAAVAIAKHSERPWLSAKVGTITKYHFGPVMGHLGPIDARGEATWPESFYIEAPVEITNSGGTPAENVCIFVEAYDIRGARRPVRG